MKHEWIGHKKKDASSNNKAVKFLGELYPAMKISDLEMMASKNTKKEMKQLAEELGYSKAEIKKLL